MGRVAGEGLLSAILSDQPDDVLADLRRRLEQRVADASRVLARSETELRLIEQAIAARVGGDPPEAAASPASPAGADAADGDRDREPDGRFQGIPRARILAVARTVPFPITPPRVVEAFTGQGEHVGLEQVRIALNRIAKDGNLAKVGPSLFALPGDQAATVETAHQAAEPQPPAADEAHEATTGPSDIPRDPFRQRVPGRPVSPDAFRRSV